MKVFKAQWPLCVGCDGNVDERPAMAMGGDLLCFTCVAKGLFEPCTDCLGFGFNYLEPKSDCHCVEGMVPRDEKLAFPLLKEVRLVGD
jgi:hypothetical protein